MEGRSDERENFENSDDGNSETLSSEDSGSEKSLSDVDDAVHRDENGEDATLAAGVAGAFSPGISRSTTPVPTLELREREHVQKPKDVVAWSDLPEKAQLIVITLARLSEPLTQTSLQSYMFYQLKWFDPTLSDAVIASQAGILTASFTAAQFFTALIWGRVADTAWFGRKSVILIGLLGSMVSCVGFGFSTSFRQALAFRCLGGVTNGNVGVLRTMIGEIVREKKFQAQAFVLLPMCFNIGVIIGPVLGGLLSDPAGSYPDTFGNIEFFRKFPYATPNIVSAVFLCCSLTLVWLFLKETHELASDRRDYGILLGRAITGLCRRRKESIAYTPLRSRDPSISTDLEMAPASPRDSADGALLSAASASAPGPAPRTKGRRYTQKLPFRRIFTFNVVMTFVAHFFLAFGAGTFNSLWAVFLSTPVYDPARPEPPGFQPRLPFRFTGGLGLSPQRVGSAMALLGVIGITLQFFAYPRLSARLGLLRSYRVFAFCFPVAYALIPFLAVVPSTTAPPGEKTGPGIWTAMAGLLFVQVVGRTFVLPAQTILVNNCSPHPSVLGTIHGFGVSASSLARTIGPMLCGWLYGVGLSRGCVGAVFWGLAAVAVCGLLVSFWLREGDGHEIWLEGDEEEEGQGE